MNHFSNQDATGMHFQIMFLKNILNKPRRNAAYCSISSESSLLQNVRLLVAGIKMVKWTVAFRLCSVFVLFMFQNFRINIGHLDHCQKQRSDRRGGVYST